MYILRDEAIRVQELKGIDSYDQVVSIVQSFPPRYTIIIIIIICISIYVYTRPASYPSRNFYTACTMWEKVYNWYEERERKAQLLEPETEARGRRQRKWPRNSLFLCEPTTLSIGALYGKGFFGGADVHPPIKLWIIGRQPNLLSTLFLSWISYYSFFRSATTHT